MPSSHDETSTFISVLISLSINARFKSFDSLKIFSLCFIRTKHGTFYHKGKLFYNFQTTFHLYFEKRLYLTFVYSNCVLISQSYPKLKRSAMQIVFAANSLCFEHTWGSCIPNVLRYSKLNRRGNAMISNHINVLQN